MKGKRVFKEEIVRTWHIEEECKDFLGGPSKDLGLFMRDVIFQNDMYVKTVIRGNPFHIMEFDEENLSSLSFQEIEEKCEKEAYGLNWEILVEKDENPNETLLGILKGHDRQKGKISLYPNEGKLEGANLKIPLNIARNLDDETRDCNIYHDEEGGDVFIHFNTKNGIGNSDVEKINKRQYKK